MQDMAGMKDDNNRVREWETGLPSVADLTPLSHSLISRALARAFCIPPASTPNPTSADVMQASQSTLELLKQKNSPSIRFPAFDPYPSSYESRGGWSLGQEEGTDGHRPSHDSFKRSKDDSGRRTVRSNRSPVSNKGDWDGQRGLDRGRGGGIGRNGEIGNPSAVPEFVQAYFWPGKGVSPSGPGQRGSVVPDERAYGAFETVSENAKGSSVDKSMKLADNESEDVDSGDGADGNTARTLKRPRLVWTPQLHKRFVDAVGHLGIKNAVPKTIMQLMNVEGLTRENVASHLQKYRLYLKRMQGLSTEGPSAYDPLFASTPLPMNLTPTPHFFSNHRHLRGENGASVPPFPPSGGPLSGSQAPVPPGHMSSGAMGGGMVQHFGGFEQQHPYMGGSGRNNNVPPGPPQHSGERRELQQVNGSRPRPTSPAKRILTLFPPSGHH